MHRKLLLDAYEKAYSELLQEYGVAPSQKACGDRLSEIISEKYPYSEKSLRTRHNKAKEGEDISIKQTEVLDAMAVYLTCKNYQDFSVKNSVEKESEDGTKKDKKNSNLLISFLKLNKVALIVILIITCCTLGYFYFNRPRWMEWQDTHYVEVSFDSRKLNEGTLKLYKQDRIENFKRINANCSTSFFRKDGNVRIWYGKNKEGNLQYFTNSGLNPETGKTLKPITPYMIEKYICK